MSSRAGRFAIRAFLVAPALALAACETTPKVDTDYDTATDFSRYRTYSWVYGNSPPSGMNPLVFERVRQSIDRSLSARYSAGTPGDFAVAFTVGRRDSVQVTDFGSYGPYYRPYAWGAWGGGYRDIDVRNVTDGTLVIDIYDAATKKPVWHGMATSEVDPNKVTQEQIDKGVDAVLAKFPPTSAK